MLTACTTRQVAAAASGTPTGTAAAAGTVAHMVCPHPTPYPPSPYTDFRALCAGGGG